MATGDGGRDNANLFDVVVDAWAAATEQPSLSGASDTQICSGFFTAPTPCDIYPAVTNSVSDSLAGAASELLLTEDASASSGMAAASTCQKTWAMNESSGNEIYKYWEFYATMVASKAGTATFEHSHSARTDRNAINMLVGTSQLGYRPDIHDTSTSDARGLVGYRGMTSCIGAACDVPVSMNVTLSFTGTGYGETSATPYIPVVDPYGGSDSAVSASARVGWKVGTNGSPFYVGQTRYFTSYSASTPLHPYAHGTNTITGTVTWPMTVNPRGAVYFWFAELSAHSLSSATLYWGAKARYDFDKESQNPPLWFRATSVTLTITSAHCWSI